MKQWQELISDWETLQFVSGIKEDFITVPPCQTELPPPYKFNESHQEAIDNEVEKLVKRNIVSEIVEG